MYDLDHDEEEKISKFFHLSLSLLLRGFDEMEMKDRLELIKLLSFMMNIVFDKMYLRMNDLEERVASLELHGNKKK